MGSQQTWGTLGLRVSTCCRPRAQGPTHVLRGVDRLVCLDKDVAGMWSYQHRLLHERGVGSGCPVCPDDDVLLSRFWGVYQSLGNLERDAHTPQALLGAKLWARQLSGSPLALFGKVTRYSCAGCSLHKGTQAKQEWNPGHIPKPPAEGAVYSLYGSIRWAFGSFLEPRLRRADISKWTGCERISESIQALHWLFSVPCGMSP